MAAIVCTLRDAVDILPSFLRYHRAIGFERFYLYFDDAEDPAIDLVADQADVHALRRDAALEARWAERFREERIYAFRDEEVMARQLLNAELAIETARQEGVRWLVHIDSDELFWVPGGDARGHFGTLDAKGVEAAIYYNLEAVVEQASVNDCFREVTLFKTNPALLEVSELRLRRLLRDVPPFREQFFVYYRDGKSAARVATDLRTNGVHQFRFPGRGVQRAIFSRPAILHYAVCGFEAFWRKYRQLGAFKDTWFGEHDISAQIGPFHLKARDVVAAGDRDRALAFYREQVILDDPQVIARLSEAGVLLRVTEPAEIVGSESGARVAPTLNPSTSGI